MRKTTLLLITVLFAACGQPDAGMEDTMEVLTDDDVQAILALDRQFQTAIAEQDYEALRYVFASDAVSMPPGHAAIRGIDDIIAFHSESGADITYVDFDTDSDVVDGDDTAGYQWGTWSAVTTDADGNEVTTQGKFMWILRHNENGWRVVADIWNSTPLAGEAGG